VSVAIRLVAFLAGLAVAFGGAALAGAAIDPTDGQGEEAPAPHGESNDPASSGTGAHGEHGAATPSGGDPAVSGLATSEGGYTLEPQKTIFEAGEPARLRFTITDPRGRAVREGFEPTHERELHLIAVRRDTAIFEHVHPRRDADGTWSVELPLREPGTYRVYADFQLDGEKRTLATDIFVPGDFQPNPLPEPSATDEAAGYDVELRSGGLRAGEEGELTFAVTRGGRPAENLQPYLGAKGHLVALREGDLAYLHVHPTGGDAHSHGGETAQAHDNEVPFAATFPTPGRYRLFLQFKTGDRVRTVGYTMEVPR